MKPTEKPTTPDEHRTGSSAQEPREPVHRPPDRVETPAGRMGDVFGDHEDTLRYLDEERRGWERP